MIICRACCLLSIDVNECATNNGNCDQICNNTKGSYQCKCGNGFALNSDKHKCDGKSGSQDNQEKIANGVSVHCTVIERLLITSRGNRNQRRDFSKCGCFQSS